MVTVKLYGRLGNQLFQKAAAIGYGVKYHIPYVLDPEKRIKGHQSTYVHREKAHSYEAIPHYRKKCPATGGVILDGYFQSEKYFSHCREAVLKEFGFKWEPKPSWVAIHVRRGDYLLYPDKHPVVTMEYLTAAMKHFEELGNTSFMVFSDDISWCEQAFSDLPYTFAYSVGRNEREDLELMSGCAHQIISNSTFSWWAAWLNRSPDKIVVSPSKDNWFGVNNKHLSTDDLIPDSWIQIKY